MSEERVTIFERIFFKDNEAVSWQRSFDGGVTWEQVRWPGDKLPFVKLNPAEIDYVIEKTVESKESFLAKYGE